MYIFNDRILRRMDGIVDWWGQRRETYSWMVLVFNSFQMAQACPPPPYPPPRSPAPARDAGGPDAAERLRDGGIGPQFAGEALRPDVWRRAVHSTARRYIYAHTLTYYICIHI